MKPFTYYNQTFDYESVKEAILPLNMPSFAHSVAAILFDWSFIVFSISCSLYFKSSLFIYILSVFVIAARQHALLILMHDGAHGNLHPNRKINEWVSDIFCALPHFLTTEGYRRDHLAHHRFVGTDLDPNWKTKEGLKDWNFPKKSSEVLFLLLRDILGYGFFRIMWFVFRYKKNNGLKKDAEAKGKWPVRLFFYAVIFAALINFGFLKYFVLYWLIPFFTVLPALLRLRTLSEHYGLERKHDFDISRNYSCNKLERFFLAPHFVNYHLDHHLYMTIPFFKLPKLHKILTSRDDFNQIAHQSRGILSTHQKSILTDLSRN